MLDSALYAIIQLLRFALPSLLTLVLLAMEGLFLGFMAWYYIMPMVTLPSVFFWALYRPALMPLFVAVIIGLAEGAVFNSPLGLAVVPLVITVALVQVARRRLLYSGFGLQWLTLAFLILIKVVIFIGFEALLNPDADLALLFYLNKMLVSIVLYPLIFFLLSWIQFTMGDS